MNHAVGAKCVESEADAEGCEEKGNAVGEEEGEGVIVVEISGEKNVNLCGVLAY